MISKTNTKELVEGKIKELTKEWTGKSIEQTELWDENTFSEKLEYKNLISQSHVFDICLNRPSRFYKHILSKISQLSGYTKEELEDPTDRVYMQAKIKQYGSSIRIYYRVRQSGDTFYIDWLDADSTKDTLNIDKNNLTQEQKETTINND